MANSGLSTSDKSPDHSSSKLKQKKALLFKKKMFSRKPTGVVSRFKKVHFESAKKSTSRYEQKVEKTINPRGCMEQNTSAMKKVEKTSNPRGCVEQNTSAMNKVEKTSNPHGCVEQNTSAMKKVKETSNPRRCAEQNTSPVKEKKSSNPRGCVEQNTSAMKRALEVQANLPSKLPSFVKFMLRSHVTGGFWLSFPLSFARAHLPKHDDTVVLVGENEGEYNTKYLKDKNGLSGGWRGFSIAHKLLEGDVLVFQLIEPCKFKVYIARANNLTEIDGAISLLNLDIDPKPTDQIETNMAICDKAQNEYLESPKRSNHQDDDDQEKGIVLNSDHELLLNLSGNDSDDLGSDVLEEGIRFSESAIDFSEVKSFDSFNILVDGLIIDSEVPIHIRHKYYDLCCSQKSFIHDHLVGGLNCKLAAGIISETVNIADAIRSATLTTSCDFLQTWDKTLKAFEDLGMGVRFLRERLKMLVDISCEQQKKIELKKLERTQLEEEMRVMESKLLNIKEAMKNLNSEIEVIKVEGKRFELSFKEVASAQW